VSVLLHDLVAGDQPTTICGRERNPTGIESAIRARFVRDSFHNLSTGLPTGLPRHLAAGRSRAAAMGNPRHCLENARGEGTGPAPLSPPRRGRKSTRPTRGQHCSCRDMMADRAHRPPVCRGTERTAACPGGRSEPDRSRGAQRAGRDGRVRRRLPDLWEACIFRVARCTRGSERGWNPLAGAQPRRAIRYP
jgi:hypothetical protein